MADHDFETMVMNDLTQRLLLDIDLRMIERLRKHGLTEETIATLDVPTAFWLLTLLEDAKYDPKPNEIPRIPK